MRYCRAMRWSCAAGALSLAVAVSATMAGVLAPRTSGEGLFDQALRRPLSSDRRSVQRSAVALLHPRQLDALQAGDALQLNLFDDTTRTFVLDRRLQSSPNRYQMIGHLQNEPDSTVIMVRRDQAVAGLIRSETAGTFLIRPAVGHGSLIQQIDETLMPPCGIGPEHAVHGEGALANAGAEAFCGSVRIDLLVVYSPEARQAAGGTAAMEAMIDLSIADTNLSYLRSEVGQRIYQVHAAELSQPESGSFFTDLGRLRTVGDGFYDEAHTLRDLYGADMVAMLIADTSLGGLAYIQLNPGAGFADSAFSVTNWLWAPLSVLAHELGHNMGCAHDRQNSSGGAFPHSYGYRYVGDSGEQWRTVMAYNPGSRIQNFSNPNVNVDGQPTGVPIGDPLEAANHDTLNQTAAIIAAYRPSVIDTGDPGAQGTEIVAPEPSATDFFGLTVAIDGDLAVVGAPQDNQAGENAGAAYVYRFDGQDWSFTRKLIGSQTEAGDRFGRSVAIDDDTILVGSVLEDAQSTGPLRTGVVYVFRQNTSLWVEEARLLAEVPGVNDQFGVSVDLDGDRAIVGADLDDNLRGFSAGSAHVFLRVKSDWFYQATLLADDGASFDGFGLSVGIDDDAAVVGAWTDDVGLVSNAGSAYVFYEEGGQWTQQQQLNGQSIQSNDQFGYAVAIDDDVILVGALKEDLLDVDSGAAYLYGYDPVLRGWSLESRIFPEDGAADDQFGVAVSLSDGAALVGAHKADVTSSRGLQQDAGKAYVFRDNGQIWYQDATLTRAVAGSGDQLGIAVSLSSDVGAVGAWSADTGLGAVLITAGSVATIDCNENEIPDACDIVSGESSDCNGNAVPDTCDIAQNPALDIDGNDVLDACEDCNFNGLPDGIDIASDPATLDCNGNGILDECEVGTSIVVSSEVFSPFGAGDALNLTIVNAPSTVNDVFLEVVASGDLETASETVDVELNGITVGTLFQGEITNGNCAAPALQDDLLISAALYNAIVAGGNAIITLLPSGAVDGAECAGLSSLQFSVTYSVPSPLDINANQIIDACEDCNGNQIPDFIDLISGASLDCNQNGIPDECEFDACIDCNGNGIDDLQDLVSGVSNDCNDNGTPDECDIADGISLDLNNNGVADECECPADCQEQGPDGVVNVVDLLWLLVNWETQGSCDMVGPSFTPPDGVINTPDLLYMLITWGACP